MNYSSMHMRPEQPLTHDRQNAEATNATFEIFQIFGSHPEYVKAATSAFEQSMPFVDFTINTTQYQIQRGRGTMVIHAIRPLVDNFHDRWFVLIDQSLTIPLSVSHTKIQQAMQPEEVIVPGGGTSVETYARSQSFEEAKILLGDFLSTIDG